VPKKIVRNEAAMHRSLSAQGGVHESCFGSARPVAYAGIEKSNRGQKLVRTGLAKTMNIDKTSKN
jgi:hypothetical protein